MPCFTKLNQNDKCDDCYINHDLNHLKCFEKCNYNYDKCITNDLYYINKEINLGIINNYSDMNIYSYEITSETNELKTIHKNSTIIEISPEIKEALIKEFKLDEEKDKIYVLILDFISNDTNKVTNDYNYKFFLENGTELNLSNIKEDYYIDIYVHLTDLESSNFNYSKYFAEQGYDIYDKNSDFYNDICSPAYINNNDITLSDRKKDIYPSNIVLCKDNCYYSGINREEEMIKCKCNLNANYTNSSDDDFLSIVADNNFISYFLDKINYKIFKCNKLLYDFGNLKSNFAFYTILCSLFILLLFNAIFYAYEISRVKNIIMNKDNPPNNNKSKYDCNNNLSVKSMIIKTRKNNPIKKKRNKVKRKKKNINNKRKTQKNKENYNIKGNKISYKRNIKNNKLKNSSLSKNKKTSSKNSIINFDLKVITKNTKIKVEIKNKKKFSKKDSNDLNELPYKLALNRDKRNIFEISISIIVRKIELINLFCGDEKIKIILICQYILSLLINFFFNTLLYTDDVVSNKYHNNGQLDLFVTIVLSLLSNVITSIFLYFVNFSKELEEKLDEIYKVKINNNYYIIIKINHFFRNLKIKMFIFIIKELIIISICFYYIIIFCIIYSYSRKALVFNYLTSLFEGFLTSLLITIVIVFTRKVGLSCSNRYFYNISKYVNNKF